MRELLGPRGRPNLGAIVNDDLALIDEALCGNSSAFGRLVTRYQDRLYNTLVHVTGSAEDGRDVCQDAFVQAYVKLSSFQRSSAFYTWLYRIALNMAASRRRRKKPTVSVEQHRESTGYEPVGRDGQPSEPLERQERAARVQEALSSPWTTISAPYWCCARSTAIRTRRLRKCSTCRWERYGAGYIGREWNYENSLREYWLLNELVG